MDRIASRRFAARVRKLATQYTAEQLSLTSPKFNIREILKQMVLLEDHLLHPYKRCPDCIHKHLISIEAFAEEGVSLDIPDGELSPALVVLASMARGWMEAFHDGVAPAELAQRIRKVRKRMTTFASDPRDIVNRIASVSLARIATHKH